MFKFLLYLFSLYILFRLVLGALFGSKIINSNRYEKSNQNDEEGKLKVKSKPDKTTQADNAGEYVDYEEVK